MTMTEQVSVEHGVDRILWAYRRDGIVWSHDECILWFYLVFHTDFQSDYTSLQPYHQWMSILFSPYPLQHLRSVVSFIFATQIGARWNLKVFIYISLIARYKVYRHFLPNFISSFEHSGQITIYIFRMSYLCLLVVFSEKPKSHLCVGALWSGY